MKPDVEMSLGDHLVELRTRIVRALVAIVVCAIGCGVFYSELFNFIAGPYEIACHRLAGQLEAPYIETGNTNENQAKIPEDIKRQINRLRNPQMLPGGPTTLFTTIILLCLACGLLISSPWVFYQIWAFVGVGLHPHERRFIYVYGPFSFLLFLAGGGFAYFTLMLMLQALMSIGVTIRVVDPSQYSLTDYVRFVAWTTLAFGLAFQTPLVVMFLERTGIVPLESLVKQQRMVILAMCIIAAVFTPGTDPISMASMGIPLILLYELGLLLAWLTGRKRRQLAAAERAAEQAADAEAARLVAQATAQPKEQGESPYQNENPYQGEKPPDDLEPMH